MLSQWNVGFIFLDLWLLLEMSDEVLVFSSFRSSFRLSGSFSRIGALVFSETQLGVNGRAGWCVTKPIPFWQKWPKIVKSDPAMGLSVFFVVLCH